MEVHPLLPRPRNRDAAFEAFYRETLQAMAQAAATVVSPDEVEDVVQEAMLRVFLHRAQLGGLDNAKGWAYRIALRVAYTRRARVNRVRAREVHLDLDAGSGAPDALRVLEARRDLELLSGAELKPSEVKLLELVLEAETLADAAKTAGRQKDGFRGAVNTVRGYLRKVISRGNRRRKS